MPALLLRVHKPWFDAIAHGHKKYEYRRVTPYWTTRIEGRQYDKIVFQNGYGARFPTMDVEYLGYDIITNEQGEPHFRLRLGAISNVLFGKAWRAEPESIMMRNSSCSNAALLAITPFH